MEIKNIKNRESKNKNSFHKKVEVSNIVKDVSNVVKEFPPTSRNKKE